MRVIDPGHKYALHELDHPYAQDGMEQVLSFVKREGDGYPGNVGHNPGAIIQEVMRAVIDRLYYTNIQIPSEQNRIACEAAREIIYQLEKRAALRHNRPVTFHRHLIEEESFCLYCGHVGCPGSCERKMK